MKIFSENIDSLRKLYINQLRMTLSSEQQIAQGLQEMIERATDPQLKQAFQSHLQETQVHITRVQDILSGVTGEASEIRSKVVAALIGDAKDMVKESKDESVRDVCLITAGQRLEHYEIAVYGTLRHFAQVMGETAQAEMLNKTLEEEKHADHLLTEIASRVNPYAEKAA